MIEQHPRTDRCVIPTRWQHGGALRERASQSIRQTQEYIPAWTIPRRGHDIVFRPDLAKATWGYQYVAAS